MGAAVFGIYALLFGVLTVKHVSYALVALICMFAFEQWGALYISTVAANGTYVNIGVLVLTLLCMLRLPPTVVFEFVDYPIRSLIFLLLVYAYLSTAWAPSDAYATSRFIGYLHYMLAYVVIAPLLLVRSEDFTNVLDAVGVLGGMLVALFAYVPNFEGRSITTEYDLEETVGLPLALGDFAGVVMIIVLIRSKPQLLSTLWAIFVAGSALFLITKTGSRGQLAFSVLALLLCFPVRWKQLTVNRVLTLIVLLGLAVIALLFVLLTENTLSTRLLSDTGGIDFENSVGSRAYMIKIVLDTWSSSDFATLIFGLGNSASWSKSLSGTYPHVVPLEVLGELGLFGFTLFSIMVCAMFFMAFSSKAKSARSDQSARDFAALFGCFVYALLISTKQSAFIHSLDLLMYAILAEKCFRVGGEQRKRKRRRRRKRMKHPAMIGTT